MFGGAFDPPHRAHVALAQAAVQQLGLDVLYLFPTGQAWHRGSVPSAAEHRLAMARLAFASVPAVRVDDREMRRAGPTYSIDTLRELAAEHPGAQLHLVMGEDQAAGFTRWHAWQDIVQLASLAVAARGDATVDAIAALQELPAARVTVLRLPRMPESATTIRARRTAGLDISTLVDPAVASYIDRHNLYRPA